MMDMKKTIFDLAEHEKILYHMGALTEEYEQWIKEALGDENDNFTSDDLYGLGINEIKELIDDFIEHCEEETRPCINL